MKLPGLKARGVYQTQGPDGTVVECETFTCCHCNSLVQVPHRGAPEDCGGFCMSCNQMQCLVCAQKQTCAPFLAQIEQTLSRDRFRRAAGLE
jgi:hypothetical protein